MDAKAACYQNYELSFATLPLEVQIEALTYLSPHELRQTACVSRKLNDIASHDYLWKDYLQNNYGSNLNLTDEQKKLSAKQITLSLNKEIYGNPSSSLNNILEVAQLYNCDVIIARLQRQVQLGQITEYTNKAAEQATQSGMDIRWFL